MKEAIACVLTSFARSAPADTHLIIRNHSLDNGLIDYAGFIASFAAACGISDRVHFIEGGKAHQMMDKSLGVVVLNSTIGISALRQAKPVYCVGTSIYAKPGLAVTGAEMPLERLLEPSAWTGNGCDCGFRACAQDSCPGQREFLYPGGHQHGH